MKNLKILVFFLFFCLSFQGCVLTKAISVPMRIVGAAISIVPVAGNTAHDAIDEAAEIVDDLPF